MLVLRTVYLVFVEMLIIDVAMGVMCTKYYIRITFTIVYLRCVMVITRAILVVVKLY